MAAFDVQSPIFTAPLIDFTVHAPEDCGRPCSQFADNNSIGSIHLPSLPIGASLGASVGGYGLLSGSANAPWSRLYGNIAASDDDGDDSDGAFPGADDSQSTRTAGESMSTQSTPQARAATIFRLPTPPPPPSAAVRARSPPQVLLDALDASGDIFLPVSYETVLLQAYAHNGPTAAAT